MIIIISNVTWKVTYCVYKQSLNLVARRSILRPSALWMRFRTSLNRTKKIAGSVDEALYAVC